MDLGFSEVDLQEFCWEQPQVDDGYQKPFQYDDTCNKLTSRNAVRERLRVRSLRTAFENLQKSLPAVPPNTKLSKLDVLVLATNYISHLMRLLQEPETFSAEVTWNPDEKSYLHPVKKWPMRSRLYAGLENNSNNFSSSSLYTVP